MTSIILIIAFINPFLGFLFAFLDMLLGEKNWRIDIISFSMFFSNLSYCYIPENNGPDLYRYFIYADSLNGLGLIDALKTPFRESNLYALNVLIWIANKMGDIHLVPALSVFVVYYICFYVTCKTAEQECFSSNYLIMYLMMAMVCLDWYGLTNNLRNVLAFTVIGFAIYRDVYLKKRNVWTIICYCIPIFIHPTALIFVLVRLMLFILAYKRKACVFLLAGVFLLIRL